MVQHLVRRACSFRSLCVFVRLSDWMGSFPVDKDIDWYGKWETQRSGKPAASSTEIAAGPYSLQEGDILEWSDIQHFVIVTNYDEPEEMLKLLTYTLMSQ